MHFHDLRQFNILLSSYLSINGIPKLASRCCGTGAWNEEEKELKVNTRLDWEPVKLHEDGG